MAGVVKNNGVRHIGGGGLFPPTGAAVSWIFGVLAVSLSGFVKCVGLTLEGNSELANQDWSQLPQDKGEENNTPPSMQENQALQVPFPNQKLNSLFPINY